MCLRRVLQEEFWGCGGLLASERSRSWNEDGSVVSGVDDVKCWKLEAPSLIIK